MAIFLSQHTRGSFMVVEAAEGRTTVTAIGFASVPHATYAESAVRANPQFS